MFDCLTRTGIYKDISDRWFGYEVNPGYVKAQIWLDRPRNEPKSASDLKRSLKIVIFGKGQFYSSILYRCFTV